MASSALLPVRPHSGFPSLSLLNLRGDLSLGLSNSDVGWGARGSELGYTPRSLRPASYAKTICGSERI